MSRDFLNDEILVQTTLQHHGIMGQKWGVRRYQNKDGTLTEAGKKRYLTESGQLNKKGQKKYVDLKDGKYYQPAKYSQWLWPIGTAIDIVRLNKIAEAYPNHPQFVKQTEQYKLGEEAIRRHVRTHQQMVIQSVHRHNRMFHSEYQGECLYHHGIMGQKWGVRRFQNKDGTLTEAGKKRYLTESGQLNKKGRRKYTELGSGKYHQVAKYSYFLGALGALIDAHRLNKAIEEAKNDPSFDYGKMYASTSARNKYFMASTEFWHPLYIDYKLF